MTQAAADVCSLRRVDTDGILKEIFAATSFAIDAVFALAVVLSLRPSPLTVNPAALTPLKLIPVPAVTAISSLFPLESVSLKRTLGPEATAL